MLSFFKRANLTLHPLAQKLFKLMEQKQSNLSVALDVITKKELLALADALGPEICVLKTHIDILEDYTSDLNGQLRKLAHKHQFLLFEDRKFADIGNTALLQYQKGMYRIAEWADFVNAHILPGPGIIEGLKQVGKPLGRGLLLVAEMSSAGAMTDAAYAKQALAMGEAHRDFVFGFICQKKLSEDPGMIHFTPGIKMHEGNGALGQRYTTIDEAIGQRKTDIVIVGRDITGASDPSAAARMYRSAAWECHQKTVLKRT